MQLAQLSIEIIVSAVLGGILPTFLWLFFWLKQFEHHEGPRGIIILSFLIGIACVLIVIPIQHYAHDLFGGWEWFVFIAAGVEEVVKFGMLRLIVIRRAYIDDPVDYALYLIPGALGFAALENTLYLLTALTEKGGGASVALVAGTFRFFGSTVIHAVCAALIALWLGMGYTKGQNQFTSKLHLVIIGLITAIALHGAFNYFIISENKLIVLATIAITWLIMIAAIIVIHKACKVKPCLQPSNY
jgi:RsiW-degrading membrane proteinase PrsW (M82 family)